MRIWGKKTCTGQIDIIRNEVEELVELPALSGRYIIKRGDFYLAFLLYGNWEKYLFFFEKMTVESDNGCGGVDIRFSFGRKGCEIKIIDIFGSYDQILTVKFRGRFTL